MFSSLGAFNHVKLLRSIKVITSFPACAAKNHGLGQRSPRDLGPLSSCRGNCGNDTPGSCCHEKTLKKNILHVGSPCLQSGSLKWSQPTSGFMTKTKWVVVTSVSCLEVWRSVGYLAPSRQLELPRKFFFKTLATGFIWQQHNPGGDCHKTSIPLKETATGLPWLGHQLYLFYLYWLMCTDFVIECY